MDLLSFEEASRFLGACRRTYLGLREIPVERIVGSVDRASDFDRDFTARRRLSRSRLASLRKAFPDGAMPAIVVFEVGGAYFVEDGHHRVALARERHMEFIDAEVTQLRTEYELAPDVDVCRLVHTDAQRVLYEESGLALARPDAVIEFTLLDGYTQLRDIIKAFGYELARESGTLPPPEEVAARWYDTVYLPGVAACHAAGLPELYRSWHSTDADLFLWIYQLRRDLRAHDPKLDFEAAAQHARTVNLGRARKRHHLREGRRPLPRRTR